MKIVLDTNFILTCLKKKIQIKEGLEETFQEKIEIVLLSSVLKEIKKLSCDKKRKLKERFYANVFLRMVEENKEDFFLVETKIENVDYSIEEFCKKNPEAILATFDKNLRKKVNNKKMSIQGKKFVLV
ncbi:MAG: hypothetical protein QW273_02980 [Candidatus Pacearchaeota archaeon]